MILAVLSGTAVGVSLGLIGGGGSILAVPLLLYVVGVQEPHLRSAPARSPSRPARLQICSLTGAQARSNGAVR